MLVKPVACCACGQRIAHNLHLGTCVLPRYGLGLLRPRRPGVTPRRTVGTARRRWLAYMYAEIDDRDALLPDRARPPSNSGAVAEAEAEAFAAAVPSIDRS